MRGLPKQPATASLHRVERCLLRLLLVVVIVGPVLAAVGVGGTLWGLIGFLVIFGVAAALFISRELRPAVTLLWSAERQHVWRA